MGAMASLITNLTIVYSTVYSDKKNVKAPRQWPLCLRWIHRTNGQQRGKCFHLMTSSCFGHIGQASICLCFHYQCLHVNMAYISVTSHDYIYITHKFRNVIEWGSDYIVFKAPEYIILDWGKAMLYVLFCYFIHLCYWAGYLKIKVT